MFSKEAIINVCKNAGLSEITSGLIGGFGGGVAQVSVLGPCTFLVTASVTGETKHCLSCTVLYCTVLYCTVLYCTVLYSIVIITALT